MRSGKYHKRILVAQTRILLIYLLKKKEENYTYFITLLLDKPDMQDTAEEAGTNS